MEHVRRFTAVALDVSVRAISCDVAGLYLCLDEKRVLTSPSWQARSSAMRPWLLIFEIHEHPYSFNPLFICSPFLSSPFPLFSLIVFDEFCSPEESPI